MFVINYYIYIFKEYNKLSVLNILIELKNL